MGYTYQQMQAMGAKPKEMATTTPKKKYTYAELQAMGGVPSVQNATNPIIPQSKSLLQKAAGVTDAIFGGGKVGELIGTQAAKGNLGTFIQKKLVGRDLSPEEEALVSAGPTTKQVVGSVAQAGLTFLPVGKLAKGVGALTKLNKLGKAGSVMSNVGVGLGGGYGYDVASGYAQGEERPLKAGVGTVVGGAVPLVGPVLKGVGKLAGETVGATTGTGFGSVKQAIKSTTQGGEQATAFREAMRGNTTPESIVNDAKNALAEVVTNRSNAYKSQLETLIPNTKAFDIAPVISKFNKQLSDFGVTFNKGIPDFSRSPGLGRYEKDLTKMSSVIADWGSQQGDTTVVGIDKLKQVLDDFRIGSADSRKFDSFVTALRNEAKGLIKNEPGYDKLVKDYEGSTALIKDIQKGLSLGDKVQTDTAFRKLTSVLRTNNEFRKQLVDELDNATGGTLSSKIAGQQMSEILPRGLMKVLGTVGAAGGVASGVGIVPMLKIALLTSPRLVGEVLSAAGYTASKINGIIKTIAPQGYKFPGDAVYDGLLNKRNQVIPTPIKKAPSILGSNVSNIKSTIPPILKKSNVKGGAVNDFFEPAPKKSLKGLLGDTRGSIANPLGKGETSLQQLGRLRESSAKINRLNPKALDTIENFIDFQAGKFDNVDDVTVLRENIDIIAKELGITETGPKLANKLREILDARMGSASIRKARMLKVKK